MKKFSHIFHTINPPPKKTVFSPRSSQNLGNSFRSISKFPPSHASSRRPSGISRASSSPQQRHPRGNSTVPSGIAAVEFQCSRCSAGNRKVLRYHRCDPLWAIPHSILPRFYLYLLRSKRLDLFSVHRCCSKTRWYFIIIDFGTKKKNLVTNQPSWIQRATEW